MNSSDGKSQMTPVEVPSVQPMKHYEYKNQDKDINPTKSVYNNFP